MKVRSIIMSSIAIVGVSALLLNGINTASAGKDKEYEDREEHEYARELKEQGKILPLQDIIERATQRHKGKVIETELERKGKGYVYEIKILDNEGKVWEMKYDAAKGEMLKEEQED